MKETEWEVWAFDDDGAELVCSGERGEVVNVYAHLGRDESYCVGLWCGDVLKSINGSGIGQK